MIKPIRQQLRDAMERNGWSQYALARASGVPQPTISAYLAGTLDTTTERADALLAAARRKPPKKSAKKSPSPG